VSRAGAEAALEAANGSVLGRHALRLSWGRTGARHAAQHGGSRQMADVAAALAYAQQPQMASPMGVYGGHMGAYGGYAAVMPSYYPSAASPYTAMPPFAPSFEQWSNAQLAAAQYIQFTAAHALQMQQQEQQERLAQAQAAAQAEAQAAAQAETQAAAAAAVRAHEEPLTQQEALPEEEAPVVPQSLAGVCSAAEATEALRALLLAPAGAAEEGPPAEAEAAAAPEP